MVPYFAAVRTAADDSAGGSFANLMLSNRPFASLAEAAAERDELLAHNPGSVGAVVEAADRLGAMEAAHLEFTGERLPIPDHVRRAAQDAQQDDEGTEGGPTP